MYYYKHILSIVVSSLYIITMLMLIIIIIIIIIIIHITIIIIIITIREHRQLHANSQQYYHLERTHTILTISKQ